MDTIRDYDSEFLDTEKHKYSYAFDEVLRRYMAREFSNYISGQKVLELGCFEGDFTKYLVRNFPQVHVIEASSKLVEVASKKFSTNVTFTNSTFEDAEIDETFDGIFIVHTLEHLDDPVGILKKTQQWLKPNARIAIAVPNANAPSRQIAVKMGLLENTVSVTDDEKDQGHRVTYTLDTLAADVKKSGYNIVKIGGVFFKGLANFQYDRALELGIIGEEFLEASYLLGMTYPDLCATIYIIAEKLT